MAALDQLIDAAEWLKGQSDNIILGLRNGEDAMRLYRHAQAHPELPQLADEWEREVMVPVIGYHPSDERRRQLAL